ncbi:hypothetical protein [Streptomyces cyaneofuscatus]|uniref:Uncharacterized protein n=1 Tax=Streptomyces cyaneofuscatus TaxID=66883 RepID=A0ABZ1F5K8_9ACTN|nr:hypothetical protein [Streptomyces cyaneofuscatus]WSB11718.1 hypothetical protein OG849_32860 [Streptomyces cyaneofuscatus]WSD44749.1 hypothetical protein OG857_02540 [Streptomyces cyaneofuscatus]WTA87948.1 hypothetical protein OG323_02635 [Streptomyces cyaneofuscatus]
MSFDPGAADTAHIEALERHFGDLRDGTHGHHGDTVSRAGKERHFARAVELLEPYALKVLGEFDTALFHEEGRVESSGLQRTADGGLVVNWTLSWAEQRASGIDPITLQAYFGPFFHHPHLRGATVREWPLNVFSEEQAAECVPVLRVVAMADLHNLVFQRDFRIVPAIVRDAQGRPVTAAPNAVTR